MAYGKMDKGVAAPKMSSKAEMEPKLGGKKGSPIDAKADVKMKDEAVYVKSSVQDQKKQAGV